MCVSACCGVLGERVCVCGRAFRFERTIARIHHSIMSVGSTTPSLSEELMQAEVVKVMYKYESSDQENHLVLRPGDYIVVLERDTSGWWIGRNRNDEVGLFPANYTEPARVEDMDRLDAVLHGRSKDSTHRSSSGGGVAGLEKPAGSIVVRTHGSTAKISATSSTARAKKMLQDLGFDADDVIGDESDGSYSGEEKNHVDDAHASDQRLVSSLSHRATKVSMDDFNELKASVHRLEKEKREREKALEEIKANYQSEVERADRQRNQLGFLRQQAKIASEKLNVNRERVALLRKALEENSISPPLDENGLPIDFSDDEDDQSSLTPAASQTASVGDSEEIASLRASVSKLEELVSQKDKSIRKLQKSLEEAVRNGSSIASASVVETSSSSPPPPASSSPPPPPMNTVEAEKSAQEKEQMKIILRELEARLKKSEARAKSLEDQNVSLGDEKRELESRLSSLQHGTEKNREQESSLLNEQKRTISSLQSEIAELQIQLSSVEKDLESSKQVSTSLQAQYSKLVASQSSSTDRFRGIASFAHEIRRGQKELARFAVSELDEFRHMMSTMSSSLPKLLLQSRSMMDDIIQKYQKEQNLRRKLFNELQELRGNIRVLCRVRPLGTVEGVETVPCVSVHDEFALSLVDPDRNQSYAFEFDSVFGPDSRQEEVFDDVKALATSVLDGYNVCIFAYGQTGSGKTFTMEGPPQNPGINYRTVRELFDIVNERTPDWQYSLSVSVIEIYLDNVYDLLGSSKNPRDEKLEIRQGKHGLDCPNMVKREVCSVEDTLNTLHEGYAHRSVGATNFNEHSSRSHCALLIWIEGVNTISGSEIRARLNLIDLAGSERVGKTKADGVRLKEAQAINLSLSTLGTVMSKLHEKASHIPYRDSKLTVLLQDSLGGDSKVNMIVNISPAVENVTESVSSLNFATRARSTELGRAEKQVVNKKASGEGSSSASSSRSR